jgi:hypothetical protein
MIDSVDPIPRRMRSRDRSAVRGVDIGEAGTLHRRIVEEELGHW